MSDLAFISEALEKELNGTNKTHSVVFAGLSSYGFYKRNWNACIFIEPKLNSLWIVGHFKLQFEKDVPYPFLSYTHTQMYALLTCLENLCLSNADEEMVLYQNIDFNSDGLWSVDTLLERGESSGSLVFEFV